jgi:DnaJ-class molecular chaperone
VVFCQVLNFQVCSRKDIQSLTCCAGKRAGGEFDIRGYYKRLGITQEEIVGLTATDISDAVKQGYRSEVKRLHPDRHGALPAEQQAIMHQRFQELQKAYEVLRDEEKRKVYDAGGYVDT